MATSYSTVTIDNIASVSTTELFVSDQTSPGGYIAVAPNEIIVLTCSVGSHPNDDITVTVYNSNDATDAQRAEITSFIISAGDTDEKDIGSFVGVPNLDIGYVASGTQDTPTIETKAQRGPLNGA